MKDEFRRIAKTGVQLRDTGKGKLTGEGLDKVRRAPLNRGQEKLRFAERLRRGGGLVKLVFFFWPFWCLPLCALRFSLSPATDGQVAPRVVSDACSALHLFFSSWASDAPTPSWTSGSGRWAGGRGRGQLCESATRGVHGARPCASKAVLGTWVC